MAGPALTVKTRPGDNLMIHKALLMAEPGDVIVVDAGGDLTNALVGELMLSHAMKIGVAGVVINGAVRDYGWIRANNFPVFAAGVTHRGPYKDGPGEINVPIALGGMVIEPGDLVIGDDDGLLCVPFDETEAVYEPAQGQERGRGKDRCQYAWPASSTQALGRRDAEAARLRRALARSSAADHRSSLWQCHDRRHRRRATR